MRLWIAVRMTIALTVLTGVIYPIAMAGLAHVLFPARANGSLIVKDGSVVGSRLIGQNFASPRYFHGRPSAAGDKGYDASNSSGSNLGPTNKALIDGVRARLKALLDENPGLSPSQVPVGLVTASGSGLDPDVTPDAAEIQVARVAKARGLSEDAVRRLVREHTEARQFGVLGEPRVNVLELNLALDALGLAQQARSK
jgi:potassium-transporting ATPase KdpC subunit